VWTVRVSGALSPEITGIFGELIYVYTRAQALEDGLLVDVSETAREAGFTIPVALTRGAWEAAVAWPADNHWQDEAGRLWDVLFVLAFLAKRSKGSRIDYHVHRVPPNRRKASRLDLKAVVSGGDDGAPVLTILLPDED
jgi:hypothetical protein